MTPRALRRRELWIFAAALAVYGVCPPFTSFDSYWTVPTSLSIVRHGATHVEEYLPIAAWQSRYALECVPAQGPPKFWGASRGCPDGHAYNLYPVAVSVIAAPLVWLEQAAVSAIGPALPRDLLAQAPPQVERFFSGDLVRGHALAELGCGAVFGALGVLLQYRVFALFLPAGQATFLTFVFAFGTAQWSVASRSLMQHGLTVLLLNFALYLMLTAERSPRRLWLAAIPIAAAFTVRPSNAIMVAALTAYVAVHHRRALLPYIACALPVAVWFFGYNLLTRHTLVPLYFRTPAQAFPPLEGFLVNLFSPSRGLLIFTPVFGFAIAGMVIAWKRRWCFPLTPYLIATVAAHAIFTAHFWVGDSFGPRYFADTAGLFALFLVPAVQEWLKTMGRRRRILAASFLALALWGVFVHSRGATSAAVHAWNETPQIPRLWDWKDPQFLRGL